LITWFGSPNTGAHNEQYARLAVTYQRQVIATSALIARLKAQQRAAQTEDESRMNRLFVPIIGP